MKITTLLRQLALLAFAAVAGRAQVAINFNTYVSLTNNELANNFTRSSMEINQTTTGGVTGGAVTGFNSAMGIVEYARFNTGQSFTSAVSTSVMFKFDSSLRTSFDTRDSYFGFGLSNNSAANRDELVGFLIQTLPAPPNAVIWARGNAPSLTGVDESFTPVDGHWYQFTTGITKVGGASNQLNLTLRLDDYGITGTSSVSTLFNTTRTFSSATWMSDTEVFAMFGTSLSSGFVAMDNFTVSAIPEPSTYAAMAGAVALVGATVWRRRQRTAAKVSGDA